MWRIEYQPDERRLTVQLAKHVAPPEMRALGQAHARALEATGGEPFQLMLDLRGLYPLDGQSAEMLSDMKRVAASLAGYRGRAVLVDSATIAMQQRNSTLEDGVEAGEIITWNSGEALTHLRDRAAGS